MDAEHYRRSLYGFKNHNQRGERACIAQESCSDPGTRPELRIPNAAAHTPAQTGSHHSRKACSASHRSLSSWSR